MKKIVIIFFLTGFTLLLHAQATDSAAIQEELQQLNNIRDSITRAQLEKEGVSPIDPGIGQEVPSEMQTNFDRVMQQQENEYKIFSKKILLLIAFIFILMASMRIILNKQRQKKLTHKVSSPSK